MFLRQTSGLVLQKIVRGICGVGEYVPLQLYTVAQLIHNYKIIVFVNK